MRILNLTEADQRVIRGGNSSLLIKKINEESIKWRERVLLGKEDHRFNQGVYCTLLDILEIYQES